MWKCSRLGGVGATILAVLGILSVAAVGVPAGQPLRATVDANSLTVSAAGAKVLEYRYGNVPFKPYVKELSTPGGLNVLLDAPHDHLHHHGLMFAVAADGVDFWSETPAMGRQKHLGFTDVVDADDYGVSRVGFQEELEWIDPAGVKRLDEQRTVCISRITSSQATVLTWESRLAAPPGKASVALAGSHYFGLGMRFIPGMDAGGAFRNADDKPGTVFRGAERLVQSNWCAYTTEVDGKNVTVAMLGHPDNPRHPTTWFTMAEPFAYLSATLGLHEEPLAVIEGKPLRLRYAVVLWDRAAESEEIERIYQQYRK